jgi:PKD repeat protein
VQIPTDTLYLDEQPTLLVSAISPDADSLRWSFGDGGTSTLAQTSHTYSTTGSFRVRCTASRGVCTTSEERTVIVRATRPAVKVQEDQLAYGLVQVTKQKTLSVVVENRFPSAIQLLSAVLEGSHSTEFGIEALSFPVPIPSMGQRSIAVSFSPAEVGLRTARLVLTFSGMAGILTVDLQGEGTLDPTDVNRMAGAVLEFDLLQSYPNPSTDFVTVPFALSGASHVRISVVDAAGRAVSVVTDGVYTPGLHTETLDTRSLRAGTYFLILEVEGRRISRAFNIVR